MRYKTKNVFAKSWIALIVMVVTLAAAMPVAQVMAKAPTYDQGGKRNPFIPYVGLTYLFSEISPEPHTGLMKTPSGKIIKFQDTVSETSRNWGLVMGVSFINKKKIGINIESRFFDQNSVGIAGELKF